MGIDPYAYWGSAFVRIGASAQPPVSPLKGGQDAAVGGSAGWQGIVPVRNPPVFPLKGRFGGRQSAARVGTHSHHDIHIYGTGQGGFALPR